MEEYTPKVAIVILNWNGKENTVECLESLKGMEYENYEIMVVDNASDDGSVDEFRERYPHISIIENKTNLGFSEGNNVGIRQALENGANYVMLLNNDTVVKDEKLIRKLVQLAEERGDAGIVGPLILYQDSDVVWFAGGKVSYLTGFCRHLGKGENIKDVERAYPCKVDYISGCCLLVSREVLGNIGLLDPCYFLYYEDTDLCLRARKQGYTCYLVPYAWVYHKKSASTGIAGENRLSELQAYYFARNAVIFGKKNLQGMKKVVYILAQFSVRFIYNLFLLSSLKALKRYLRGLYEGIKC